VSRFCLFPNMAARQQKRMERGCACEFCTVMVLYEDRAARELGLQLCQNLTRFFIRDIDFRFTWWRFAFLQEARIAGEALEAAVQSDLVLVVKNGAKELPGEVKGWFDRVPTRDGGGAALFFVHDLARPNPHLRDTSNFLQETAKRAGFDFLCLAGPPPDLPSADRLREDQAFTNMTGLDQSPNHQFHSSGWGIDE
jgi:hypothetical protein